MKRTGIETLLSFEELARHYKGMALEGRLQKSSAGLAKAQKYERLKRLARETYYKEMFKKRTSDNRGSSDDPPIKPCCLDLKPAFKTYSKAFETDASTQDWNEFERQWLEAYKLSAPTDSTLYGWWKALNKELRSHNSSSD